MNDNQNQTEELIKNPSADSLEQTDGKRGDGPGSSCPNENGEERGIVESLKKQLREVLMENQALSKKLVDLKAETVITSLALEKGAPRSAITDILNRSRDRYEFKSDSSGLGIKHEKKVISPEEWLEVLMSEAPHLFGRSEGIVRKEESHPENEKVFNPYRKETWNVTRQMQLERSEPQMAKLLRSMAFEN